MPEFKKSRLTRPPSTPPTLATLILLAGLSVMAMNIFLPVLPIIAQDLSVNNATAQYVLTVFLGATALAQLFIGPMADRFGRRPVLLWALGLFFLGSIICVFATTIEILIFGRIIQASSAACVVLSRAIIRDLYDREKSASMIGYVTMVMALIPMITPTMGGYFGEIFGWSGPFYILVAVSLAAFLLAYLDLGETHTPNHNKVSEQLQEYISLLKEPMVWGYFLTSSAASGAYFAFLGGAPFVGLVIIGMQPAELGMHFAFVAAGYMCGSFLTGYYSKRVGIEMMMCLGGVVASIGVCITIYLMTYYPPHALFLFLPMAAVGFGNGMTLPNANAGAISVRPDLAGTASGLGGFLQIGGGALLAVLSGALITLENNAMPLYIIMLLSSLIGSVIAFCILWAHRKA